MKAKAKVKAKNPNTNCLLGMRCPKCGSYGPLYIESRVLVKVFDDGTDGTDYSPEWDDDSYCECSACHYSGKVCNFDKQRVKRSKLYASLEDKAFMLMREVAHAEGFYFSDEAEERLLFVASMIADDPQTAATWD